jgi:hypothetical protein
MAIEPIRQSSKVPDTSGKIDKSMIDAQVAHEQTIRYYLEHTELGIIDEEQQSIEALLAGLNEVGLSLPGTTRFFTRQRELSSGVRGVGRVQGKEVVTAGSWPMAMFSNEKPGWIDTLKSFIPGKKPAQEGTK